MKVKIHICEEKEIEVNDPVFKELAKAYKDPSIILIDGSKCYKAMKIVEEITGIEVNDNFGDNLGTPFIIGCYTLDYDPIFEL